MKETYEDYLKSIYIISKNNKCGWVSNSEIADFMNVKPSSVTNMLHNLKELELIDWNPRKSLRLTEKGKKMALQITNRYNVLKTFFLNVLHLNNEKSINEICCKVEHYISGDVYKALEELNISLR